MTIILLAKALHVIGFISWFAGLFFLGRLLVNHADSDLRPEHEARIIAAEYTGSEARVYKIITGPAMYITLIGGFIMVGWGWNTMAYFSMGTPGWLIVKLALILGMIVYQYYTKFRIMDPMARGERPFTGWQLRLWNEVPTFFLVSISFVAVLGKAGSLNYWYLAAGVALFGLMVYRGAKSYAKRRLG